MEESGMAAGTLSYKTKGQSAYWASKRSQEKMKKGYNIKTEIKMQKQRRQSW